MGGSSRYMEGCKVGKKERSLWEPEVLKVHELFTEPLSMDGKYAVKLSTTELMKINRK